MEWLQEILVPPGTEEDYGAPEAPTSLLDGVLTIAVFQTWWRQNQAVRREGEGGEGRTRR